MMYSTTQSVLFIATLLVLPLTTDAFVAATQPRHGTALSVTTEADQRFPWNPLRFVSQSSKFVPTPFTSQAQRRVVQPNQTLWQASNNANEFTFAPLDDVVMGGASASAIDKNGVWSGRVTDANNGGFVGVRNTPNVKWDMTNCKGIELTIRPGNNGNKQRYKIGLRDTTDFNGLVYNQSFIVNGNGKTQKVKLPFSKLQATQFARTVKENKLDVSNVVGVQLIYSKFEYNGGLNPEFRVGEFELAIQEIKAY